jgi:hypothetical protein
MGKKIRIFLNGKEAAIGHDIVRSKFGIDLGDILGRNRHTQGRRPERFRDPAQSLSTRARAWARRELSTGAIFTKLVGLALHTPLVRKKFGNAWVFMDRDSEAGDSAEYLYRHISQNHPDINAWFVIKRNSSDWARLRKDKIRVVPYGSWRWQLLMLSADHLASSHADQYVTRPLDPKRFGEPRWRLTFLQHGVIKDDLSRWLNPKPIDLFITSSLAEHESIVGDQTSYKFSSKQVVLTGLPRFDALLAKREATLPTDRNLILVMPTWRHNLVGKPRTSSTDRELNTEFRHSNYASQYSALLQSPALQALAADGAYEMVFMPHPMMGPYLAEFDVPSHVRTVSYNDVDVQLMLARGALLITDYSSMAFNAAMLEFPTVYFQFDREEFYSGAHPSREGYYDYHSDGFGPVCSTIEDVEAAAAAMLNHTGAERSAYIERMRGTFAYHDKSNSERVVQAMKALNVPHVKPHASDSMRFSEPALHGDSALV